MAATASNIVNDEVVNQFRENGFAIIPGFLTEQEVKTLKEATTELVHKYCQDMPLSIFSASKAEKYQQDRNTYFSESGDKIRGFFEEKAVVNGEVVIKEREKALNKIGHALHKYEDAFHAVTFNPRVKEVLQKLTQMAKPTVIQSMVIFKQPRVGGEVQPHQDASYLYTEPAVGSLLGFWIALDEANMENGCLYFAPGSHKEGNVYQRFSKNPDVTSPQLFLYSGESIPETPKENLIAAPAKPGDLVLIDGLVVHQSESNTSEKSRLAYTFHVVDMKASYSATNWLQPTAANTFVEIDGEIS